MRPMLCKDSARREQNIKFYLNVLPSRSLSYAKIVQTERRKSSLLELSSEVPPILSKDSANRAKKVKLA